MLKQLALVMPPETRRMDAEAAQELLLGLADEALSGRAGDVVCWRRRSGHRCPSRCAVSWTGAASTPGPAQRGTRPPRSCRWRISWSRRRRRQGAPRLLREQAARRLGTDPALLEAQLRERAHDAREPCTPGGLRLDQAAAIWHALTSDRIVEVITGPAGTGKTRVLAAAAHAWDGPVFGTATSQNATNELRNAGVE